MRYRTYTTRDGDRLDLIACAAYGSSDRLQLLARANPSLLPLPPVILPRGLALVIPDLPEPEPVATSIKPPWL